MALLVDLKQPDWMTDEALRARLLELCPGADIRTAAAPGETVDIEMLAVSAYRPWAK